MMERRMPDADLEIRHDAVHTLAEVSRLQQLSDAIGRRYADTVDEGGERGT
jgi:hypothetical protein